MEKKLPTMEECQKTINEICKDSKFETNEMQHRARILYLINRFSFWEDFPVFMQEINYQRELAKSKQ